ncbi:hypothetical protein E4634_21015 [Mangrovimicrobium sediminis]|uniref:Uncharacterized protein n=1 Tax=Mangrovimicrobium sediminis TaxID=2562682 RepID=A0A4Z0LTC8_9GAMM|nr:hypothetical protein [Haliea sp. SAOS-164]TGD70531.1 hypothetical protein E4634_21015 [Haliea sp. SAOS-164]
MELISKYGIYAFIVVFFIFVMYSMFTRKGRGMILGGNIVSTSGEEIEQKSGMISRRILSHTVEAKDGTKHVGIEISENAMLGKSLKSIRLSRQEAEKFVRMLNESISKT